jgi:hypothetical protein
MASRPPVVAELGRPETPDEAAARKAQSSRVYRSSQTTRNLIAALLATLAVVAVIIFAVPRGTPPPREPIDVAAVAEQVTATEGSTAVVPQAPESWPVNRATVVADDGVRAWTIVYAPENGFVNIAQGFNADAAWPTRVLGGAGTGDTVTIEGVEWTRYEISDSSRAGNISAALSTEAGPDTILVYGGNISPETLDRAAASVSDQVITLREEAP